jgi:hypothetical protein
MLENDRWTGSTQVDSGMMLCLVERVDSAGVPWVRLPEGRATPAKVITSVTAEELSKAAEAGAKAVVALLCDTEEPVIVGIVASRPDISEMMPKPEPLTAEIDGERIVLNGRTEIVLRCGEASITLTKAGKILLRGAYVSSRSSGVNRIKGGSVQIN